MEKVNYYYYLHNSAVYKETASTLVCWHKNYQQIAWRKSEFSNNPLDLTGRMGVVKVPKSFVMIYSGGLS